MPFTGKLDGNIVVVGLQWGDEGKGKVVDLLARRAAWVARFQGGDNAGHTLVVQGRRTVLHLVPSGVLHPEVRAVIGNGVVVNPAVLVEEMDALAAAGVPTGPDRLLVSDRAHVILPVHRALDAAREEARGAAAIGTTRRGIGPTYEDKAARRGLRVGELVDPGRLREGLARALARREACGGAEASLDELLAWAEPLADRLRPHVRDTAAVLHRALDRGERILFEGAQGTFLDLDHGTWPYVTSSNTVAGAAAPGTGVGPRDLHLVVGVAKAYTTRVGAGPFPTELHGEAAERLRAWGHEYGATTGRPRRCGWFDVPLTRRAVRLNGADAVVLTKLDVLGHLDAIPVCTAHEPGPDGLPRPVFRELPGWRRDISEVRRYADLPDACRAYVERLEDWLGVPVAALSVGPGREQTIPRDEAFAPLLSAG